MGISLFANICEELVKNDSGNTWIVTRPRRLLASLNICYYHGWRKNIIYMIRFGNGKVSSVGVFSAGYSIGWADLEYVGLNRVFSSSKCVSTY